MLLSVLNFFEWKSVAAIIWKKWRRAILTVACYWLWVKNDYILLLNKYRHHQINILPSKCDIVNSRKLFSDKNRQWFFHSNRLFSLLPLKNPLWKYTSFGKSLAVLRNLAATQIFLSVFHPSKCNAFFVWITYLQNKMGKGYQWHIAFFFL